MSASGMNLLRFFFIGTVLMALNACVPWPHHELTAPEIIGSIENAGAAVPHARIQLSDMLDTSGNIAPKAKTLEVVADAEGHFRIGPIRRFVWTSHSNRPVPWGLSFSPDAQPLREGWFSDPVNEGYVLDEPVIAICNLRSTAVSSGIGGYQQLRGHGLCSMAVVGSK